MLQDVFHKHDRVYVRYAIVNGGPTVYVPGAPQVFTLRSPRAPQTLIPLANTQLAGVRFGLPVLPGWSAWFRHELERHKAIEPLIGVGCRPVLVKGTKKRFLGWIGHALKRGAIHIPADGRACVWTVPMRFQAPLEKPEEAA